MKAQGHAEMFEFRKGHVEPGCITTTHIHQESNMESYHTISLSLGVDNATQTCFS